MPGEIAECRENGQGKGVRAQREEEGQGSCWAQHGEHSECQEQQHPQTELPAPPQGPCPAGKPARRNSTRAEGNLPPERGRENREVRVSLSLKSGWHGNRRDGGAGRGKVSTR